MAATSDDILDALKSIKAEAERNNQLVLDVSKNLIFLEAVVERKGATGGSGPMRNEKGQFVGQGSPTGPFQGFQTAYQNSRNFYQGVQSATGMARASVGEAGAAAVGLTGGFIAAGYGAFQLGKALKNAADEAKVNTDRLFQQMSRAAQVSPQLAMVAAERERNQIMRDRDFGQKVAGSARTLMESENRLNQGTLEIDALWQNVQNTLQAVSNDVVATLLTPLEQIAKWANFSLFNADKKKEQSRELGEWARAMEEQAAQDIEREKKKIDAMRQRAREALGMQ